MPYSVDGSHIHKLARGQLTTLEDGTHRHWFKLSDGSLVASNPGGEHAHVLEKFSSGGTQQDTAPHNHLVLLPDGTEVATTFATLHDHEAGFEETVGDGSHTHAITLDGIERDSLDQQEFLETVGPPKEKLSVKTLVELLEMEMENEATVRADSTRARTYSSHDRPSFIAALCKAAREGDTLSVETATKEVSVEKTQGQLKNLAPTISPERPAIAFVGGAPSKLDAIRGEPFVGVCGEVLRKQFLEPMGLKREDVALMNLIPEHVKGKPQSQDIDLWKGLFDSEIQDLQPKVIVALGKTARESLGDRADVTAPHPNALRANFDSGECARKVKHIEKLLKQRETRITKQFNITATDEEKQIVTGIVLEPETEDGHGDVVSIDEIEKAAYNFLTQSRVVGDSHADFAEAELVESYLAPTDLKLGGQEVKKGTWIVSVHVTDPALWADVKSGQFNGFSIGGYATKEPA